MVGSKGSSKYRDNSEFERKFKGKRYIVGLDRKGIISSAWILTWRKEKYYWKNEYNKLHSQWIHQRAVTRKEYYVYLIGT